MKVIPWEGGAYVSDRLLFSRLLASRAVKLSGLVPPSYVNWFGCVGGRKGVREGGRERGREGERKRGRGGREGRREKEEAGWNATRKLF